MKISAKLLIALLIALMAFAVGCTGKAPEKPLPFKTDVEIAGGAKISVDSFYIASPDFVDQEKKALHPVDKNQAEVAVLRLKISNPSDSDVMYMPLHFAQPSSRIQICTEPNPETGERTNIKAVAFDTVKHIHTPSQRIEPQVKIPSGGEIMDEYLFDIPAVSDKESLIVLIPEDIVSGGNHDNIIRFYLDKPEKVKPQQPAKLNQAASIDGVDVTITKIGAEYAELEQREAPKTPLKYPYAYTEKPVLAVYMTIKNNSKKTIGYDPSHTAEIPGISLKFATLGLKRIKLPSGIIGKGQVKGAITVEAGSEVSDVYLFDRPESSGDLDFTISGHIFGVNGIYRFALNYNQSEPPKPDLEPYKSADPNAEGDENADGDGDAADGDADGGDDAAAADDEKKEDEKKDDDKKKDKKKKKKDE